MMTTSLVVTGSLALLFLYYIFICDTCKTSSDFSITDRVIVFTLSIVGGYLIVIVSGISMYVFIVSAVASGHG